jgi:hypothetical protein
VKVKPWREPRPGERLYGGSHAVVGTSFGNRGREMRWRPKQVWVGIGQCHEQGACVGVGQHPLQQHKGMGWCLGLSGSCACQGANR